MYTVGMKDNECMYAEKYFYVLNEAQKTNQVIVA